MSTTNLAAADWFALAMGLAGGLALFLFGLDQLSEGLKLAAGDSLKTLLTRLTTNRFLGALTGAMVTGILNSSSVTTVLVVGFVTAGTMTLSQSVAVIMGANVEGHRHRATSRLQLGGLRAAAGGRGILHAIRGKARRAAVLGHDAHGAGVGLQRHGAHERRDETAAYLSAVDRRARDDGKAAVRILAGAVFTGLVQSSAATVGIAIALASEGLMSLPAGIALALGANIGTCATALLAALGKPVEAVRAASVHVLFNVARRAAVAAAHRVARQPCHCGYPPPSPGLAGAARLAAEVPRQIANANTLFNIFNTAVFIGFTGWFATPRRASRPRTQEGGVRRAAAVP